MPHVLMAIWYVMMPATVFLESLMLPSGARAMMEREARGVTDPDKARRSEYEMYWAPSTLAASALKDEASFVASLQLPFGKRCMLEREARGMVDSGVPRSEYMEYWAPRTYNQSALAEEKTFIASKALPWGKRCMLEREARGYTSFDEAPKPRSEYLEYWAPLDAAKSGLKTEGAFAASLKLPTGTRAMMERAARAA